MLYLSPLILPEIIISCSALLLLVAAVISKNLAKFTNIICIAVIISVLIMISQNVNFKEEIFDDFFKANKYINYARYILCFSTLAVLLLAKKDLRCEKLSFEFPIIITFSLIGMMLMIGANDFITMYLGFELQSLCLYVLTAFKRDDENSSEAGIKYFVLGAIASGILLFGISLVYGSVGSTNFLTISNHFYNTEQIQLISLVGLIMIIIAIGFKISAAPFHIWTPDVYQGSPLIVTAYLSTVAKFAAIFLMIRILFDAFGAIWIKEWKQIIIFMSVLSMLIGSIGALKQESIKRILAYSSIGHIGYVLMGVASAEVLVINYIIIYLLIYIISNIGIFSFLMTVSKDNDVSINSFNGLSKRCLFSSVSLTILLLSLAGIPPIAGFFTKFYIFQAAIEQNLYSLALVGVISSLISAFYYLKIIKIMYFEEQTEESILKLDFSKINIALFTISALVNLLFFGFIDRINFN